MTTATTQADGPATGGEHETPAGAVRGGRFPRIALYVLVESRRALREAQEDFLDHVFARAPVAEQRPGVPQERALVARDECFECTRYSPAPLREQPSV